MFRTMFKSKIHRATVTQADLHYVGSLTIDEDLMDAADLLPGEQVQIVDITNGARLETYVISGSAAAGSSASTEPRRGWSSRETWSSSSRTPPSPTPRPRRSCPASSTWTSTTGRSRSPVRTWPSPRPAAPPSAVTSSTDAAEPRAGPGSPTPGPHAVRGSCVADPSDQPRSHRACHRMGPVPDLEPGHQLVDDVLDGVLRAGQRLGDHRVAVALGDQGEHCRLARSQRSRPGGAGSVGRAAAGSGPDCWEAPSRRTSTP